MVDPEEFEKAKTTSKILFTCDYCGERSLRRKAEIVRGWKIVKKDACPLCKRQKEIDSCRIKYGSDNFFSSDVGKEKIEKVMLDRYGTSNIFNLPEGQEKARAGMEKKYGKKHPQQIEKIRKKTEETCEKIYGAKTPLANISIRNKIIKTNESRYGCRTPLEHPAFMQKAIDSCIKNNGMFPVFRSESKAELEIKEFLNSYGFSFKKDYSLLDGQELDLYDEKKKIAIEYCGLYWHTDGSKERRDKSYHYEKYIKCRNSKVDLITIFEDEYLYKKQIVESVLLSKLGFFNSIIPARKCKISFLSKEECRKFCEQYHIQGENTLSLFSFGLFYGKKLVGVMSIGRHHRNNKDLVLDRLCFLPMTQIIGGASKLFKHCMIEAKNKIISFSDNRWGQGKIYSKLGFVLDKEYGPDYSYVKLGTKNRFSKQSQKKSNTNCPKGLTELQWANERGLYRIWDCGKKRWVYDPSSL